MVFTIISNRNINYEIRENTEITVTHSLDLTNSLLQNISSNMINACIAISNDSATKDILIDKNKTDFQKNSFQKKIATRAITNFEGAELFNAVVGTDGQTFNLFLGAENPIVNQIINEPENYKDINWRTGNYFDSELREYIVCTAPIYAPEFKGVSIVGILQQDLQMLINRSQKFQNSYILIVDKDEKIVSHTDENTVGIEFEKVYQKTNSDQDMVTETATGEEYIMYKSTVPIGNDWDIITLINYEEVFSKVERQHTMNIIYMIIFFVFIISIAVLISKTVSLPLMRLTQYIKGYPDNQKFFIKRKLESSEVVELFDTYERQMRMIQELIDQVKKDQKKLDELHFKALQAQINPHFLFNTLNNIKMMAFMNKDQNSAYMLSELGKLLEASFRYDEMITIQEELDYAYCYIKLQRYRFTEGIDFLVDFPEEILSCKIIKFTLQPLLENALSHGYESKRGCAKIELHAIYDENKITISVKDYGSGISEEKLRNLIQGLQKDENQDRIGLFNVNKRLKLTFGESYGLTLKSEKDKYTTVFIHIPK